MKQIEERFKQAQEELAKLTQKGKELDARHGESLTFAEQAEISAARADIFLDYAKIYVELAAYAKAVAKILTAAEPKAEPQPGDNIAS